MKDFEKEIKKRSVGIRIGLFILLIFNLTLYLLQKGSPSLEYGLGFQMGMTNALIFIGLYIVYKYERSLKNDQQLKKLYIQEHDERKTLIKQKICQASLIVIVLGILIADSIAVYMNMVVAYTLTATLFVSMFVVLIFKLYYFHKY